MNLFDLYEVSRRPGGAKSLYDRARKYIGAVKTPLKPRNTGSWNRCLETFSLTPALCSR